VRRVMIAKPNGEGERPLGIPTIRDRVIQTAAKMVLEPIFEADFEDSAYGYRPVRGAVGAVKEVHRMICRGYTDVVDADLSGYFDSIPHADLMKSVARRIVDRHVLRLIKLWLRAPIEERNERMGLEAGPLSQWLFGALAEAELPVVCVETRHMQAVLKAQINKTDRNDARGIAQMMRVGLYRPVHVKTLRSQKLRMLLM
jgi:hypothetical protein